MGVELSQILTVERREEGVWDVYLKNHYGLDADEIVEVGVFVFGIDKEWLFYGRFRASGWPLSVIGELGALVSRFRNGEIEPILG